MKKGEYSVKKSMKKYLLALGVGVCMMLSLKTQVSAAVDQESTETNPVVVDDSVPVASCAKYKDMDDGFLKTFDYGSTVPYRLEFPSMEAFRVSTDERLKAGIRVKTKGFYEEKDGGAGVYLIGEKKLAGGVLLANGLYANIQADTYVDAEGTRWALVNAKQFGATGNGQTEDQDGINAAISMADASISGGQEGEFDRGIAYIPAGEYKCGDKIYIGTSHTNIVGDGDNTVLFTDNDYRDEEGYSEFFLEVWGGSDTFVGKFQIEAREVDLYHYMRQFVLVYSSNIYVYQVDTIVPQGAYSSYYWEDKQYSNMCCYTGNKDITIDDCKMVQMSGTYRGANFGILDIWAAGEKNITVMNCDMYGNARDEQIGFFSKSDDNASVKHVNFLNNKVHSVQIKYPEIIGTRTMCFTVAYANSKNIEDIRIAGNHFICETDSKFMTFGTLKDCVVENNIIEIKCTNATWSLLFDSSNDNAKNILVRKNELYITSDDGYGRGNITGGNLTFTDNRLFSDVSIVFGVLGPEIHNNEMIFLETLGQICSNANCTNNNVYVYNGFGSVGTNRKQAAVYGGEAGASYEFSGNQIYDYKRYDKLEIFRSLIKLDGNLKYLHVANNGFYFPNARYLTNEFSESTKYEDSLGGYYKNVIFRARSGTYGSIVTENNKFQLTEIPESNGSFTYTGNEEIPGEEDLSEPLTTTVKIMHNGQEVKELTTDAASIQLQDVEYVAEETDAEGNVVSEKVYEGKEVKWYSSVESMAKVSQSGLVSREMYGEVHIYAVPLDGSATFGECTIYFARTKATGISVKEEQVTLQPGLKHYVEFQVQPAQAVQELTWTSSDPEVASVNYNGMILGVKPGTATITGTTTDGSGISKSIKVTVSDLTVKKINLKESYHVFTQEQIGSTYQIQVSDYVPSDATNPGIGKWESTNESVASVDSQGVVTAHQGGMTSIRAYSMDLMCYGTCNVYVQSAKVSNLETKVTNDKVTLTWDASAGAYGYYIYQWNSTKNEWEVQNNGKAIESTEYTMSNLAAGTEYKFCVRAYISVWDSGQREVYESEDAIATVKTLSYVPVTTISGDYGSRISLPLGTTGKYTMSYGGAGADGSKLTFSVQNPAVASVEAFTPKENQKYELQLRGNQYGVTTATCASIDAYGMAVGIPVGVVAAEKVSNLEVSENADGTVSLRFNGLEDQQKLLQAGAMTGYMIQRTQNMYFSDYVYVPAEDTSVYTYLDKKVSAGKTYHYTVCPCIKDGENYFVGNNNGRYSITTSITNLVTQILPQKQVYTVVMGKTRQLAAQILPENASVKKLDWTSLDTSIATVSHGTDTPGLADHDYATVKGIKLGVTTIQMKSTDATNLVADTLVAVVPTQVKNVKVVKDGAGASVVWDALEGVSGYHLYRKDKKNTNNWVQIADLSSNSYVDRNLQASSHYYYKVAAYVLADQNAYEGVESDTADLVSAGDFSKLPGVTVTGYDALYDGAAHDTVLVTGTLESDVVTFSEDETNWSAEMPKVCNIGDSKLIYVCITRDGVSYYGKVVASVQGYLLEEGSELAGKFALSSTRMEWSEKVSVPQVIAPEGVTLQDYTVTYDKTPTVVGLHKVTLTGNGAYAGTIHFTYEIYLVKGHSYRVKGYRYRLTGTNKVTVTGATRKTKKSVTVANTVSLGGKKCKVTGICAKAFSGWKALQRVTIGKHVTTVGAKAFANNKKLKKVIFQGDKITKIGKQAFYKVNKKVKFSMPKSVERKYHLLVKKA